MRLVILESPYAGSPEEVERNVAYARLCLRDSLSRNESPIASHLVYPQVLDDNDPGERALGIDAGLAWREVAQGSVVYIDLGVSHGMAYGVAKARERGIPVEARSLGLCGGICRHLWLSKAVKRPIKVGIIGAGSIGGRMAEVLSSQGISSFFFDSQLGIPYFDDEPSARSFCDENVFPIVLRPLHYDLDPHSIIPSGLSAPRGRRRGQRRSRETRY